MDLLNDLPFEAGFFNTLFRGETLLGAVIARPVFRIEDERLVLCEEESWPVDASPYATPLGMFPGDIPYLNGGVDLLVFGRVHAPGGEPVRRLDVDIHVGSFFHRRLAVFGDRRWVRLGGQLVAGEPERFETMPLSLKHAYGGATQLDSGEFAWPANPAGKGLYFTEEAAENGPLPNLEDPDDLIEKYDDRPDPVCTTAYSGSLSAMNALELDLDEPLDPKMKQIKPTLFNRAHPRMIISAEEAPRPGDEIEVTHVRPGGPLKFEMPDFALHAHVKLGRRHFLFPLHVDQIGILAEVPRVFLSFRVAFKYTLVDFERRQVSLRLGRMPSELPREYLAAPSA